MVDVRGDVLRPPHCTTPAVVKRSEQQKRWQDCADAHADPMFEISASSLAR